MSRRVKAGRVLDGKRRRARVTVHLGTCGIASGAGKVLAALEQRLAQTPVKGLEVRSSGCAGLCCREPMATVELAGEPPVKYVDLDEKKILEIMDRHVLGGEPVAEYALAVGSEMTG